MVRRMSFSRSSGPQICGCGASFDAHRDGLPADLVEGVGEALELLVTRAAGRALAHVDLIVAAAAGLEEIASEGDMIGDSFRDRFLVDEIRGLAFGAVGHIDERDARFIENLLELERILTILLDVVGVGLDALQSQGGDALDGPHDVVLVAPDGTGGSEKNVGIDGVERLAGNRGRHGGWRDEARSGRHAGQCQRGRNELPPIRSALSDSYRHGCFLPICSGDILHTSGGGMEAPVFWGGLLYAW